MFNKIHFLSIVSLWWFTSTAYGQCDDVIKIIDSLTLKKESNSPSSWLYENKQSTDCELTILEYVKGKGYYGDSINFKIVRILTYLAGNGTTKEVRSNAINAYLERLYAYQFTGYYRWQKDDYDLQARNHLIRLLRREYTPEEVERFVQVNTKSALSPENLEEQVQREMYISKRFDQYAQIKDSIIASHLEQSREYLSKRGYSIDLPILMGWLDMRETIPLLDSLAKQNDLSSKLALARMGNQEYYDYFVNNTKKADLDIAFYLNSQELIARYGEHLYSKEEFMFVSGTSADRTPIPSIGPIPVVYNDIINLQNFLENFPRFFDRKVHFGFPKEVKDIPPSVVEEAQQWMKDNKGNYKIRENYIPEFSGSTLKSCYDW